MPNDPLHAPYQGSEEGKAAKEAAAVSLAHSWCSGASASLRWWSAGSMEPLCAEPTDRLLVQHSHAHDDEEDGAGQVLPCG
eukprot:1143713-Pelagomonas_calceolata.AAC.2